MESPDPFDVSVEYIFSFLLKNISSFKFRIPNMITVCCRFIHSFNIMRIPLLVCSEDVPTCNIQRLSSRRRGEVNVLYTCYIDNWEPEAFELWAFAKDLIIEAHLYAWVQNSDDLVMENFLHPLFQCTRSPNSFLWLQIRQRKCPMAQCYSYICKKWNCYCGLN